MLLEHVVLDGGDKVALLEDARPHRLGDGGQVAQGHQRLEVLDAGVLHVQQGTDGSNNVASL